MDNLNIQTVQWSDSKALFITLASQCFGRAKNNKPADFNEFVAAYPMILKKRMYAFLEDGIKRKGLQDITLQATTAEDKCLLSAENATSIEVMLRYLNKLNAGEKIWSLWCYLDSERKAVVHFVNKGGWYAEAFFSCNEDFSVLHLIDSDGEKTFIPAVFCKDISKYASKVILTGSHWLQDYLPRIKGDFLSKGGKQGKNSPKGKNETKNGKRHTYSHMPYHDKGDKL